MELFICSFIQTTSAGHDILGAVRALGHRCEKDSCVYSWNLDTIKKKKSKQTGGYSPNIDTIRW